MLGEVCWDISCQIQQYLLLKLSQGVEEAGTSHDLTVYGILIRCAEGSLREGNRGLAT